MSTRGRCMRHGMVDLDENGECVLCMARVDGPEASALLNAALKLAFHFRGVEAWDAVSLDAWRALVDAAKKMP